MDWITEVKNNENETLCLVYKKYRNSVTAWMMKTYKLNHEDALEIFQQCVIQFYHNVREKKLTVLTCKLDTYLIGISNNMCKAFLRKRKLRSTYDFPLLIHQNEIEEKEEQESKYALLEKSIQKLGENCQNILRLFYYERYNMEQISLTLNFKNANTVKTQKYKCIKRLQKLVAGLK